MYVVKGCELYMGNGVGIFVFEKNFFFLFVVFFKVDKFFVIVIGKLVGLIGRNGFVIVIVLLYVVVG